MSRRLTLVISLGWFAFTLLACSIGAPDNAPANIPTATLAIAAPSVEPTTLTPTKVQVEVPTAPPTVPGEVLPTDTATLPPTVTTTTTPTATPSPTHTVKPRTPAATRKPTTVEPLAIRYEIVGIARNPDDEAVLTLKVIATGGGGGYAYYNDDQKQAGATFNVAGHCGKPFVHTLKVTSANGQVATQSYFIGGLCPSPTPTPKP